MSVGDASESTSQDAGDKTRTSLGQEKDSGLRGKCATCVQHFEGGELPPDLQGVVDAWPELSKGIKAGILAMVKAERDE